MENINHERYDSMVFWVDSIGKLSNIPLIKKFSLAERFVTSFIIMFVLLQTTIVISDFSGNIWVASFMVYAFQWSTIPQSGVYELI